MTSELVKQLDSSESYSSIAAVVLGGKYINTNTNVTTSVYNISVQLQQHLKIKSTLMAAILYCTHTIIKRSHKALNYPQTVIFRLAQ